MSEYYKNNYLKPNPSKTLLCLFQLRYKDVNYRLKIICKDKTLTHCSTPTYLELTLDRTLM